MLAVITWQAGFVYGMPIEHLPMCNAADQRQCCLRSISCRCKPPAAPCYPHANHVMWDLLHWLPEFSEQATCLCAMSGMCKALSPPVHASVVS